VVANSDKLVIRPVEILRFDNQDAYLSAGLKDGESVVTRRWTSCPTGWQPGEQTRPGIPNRPEVRP
jgi:hypothetical protein